MRDKKGSCTIMSQYTKKVIMDGARRLLYCNLIPNNQIVNLYFPCPQLKAKIKEKLLKLPDRKVMVFHGKNQDFAQLQTQQTLI